MKINIKPFIFHVLNEVGNGTLVGKTWNKIKRENAFLYGLRRQQVNYDRGIKFNNLRFSFLFTVIVAAIALLFCFVTKEFVATKLSWLTVVNIPEDEGKTLISENMGADATIIGLSFVVIGFLFESVRNKTQQTFEDIFRVTKLYYVFAISIVGMFSIVLMNFLKFTYSLYTTCNFATLSSLILLTTVLSIAFLFKNVLSFLSDERIAQYATNNLLITARFQYLNERFMIYSKQVIAETLESYSLQPFSSNFFNPRVYSPLPIRNNPQAVLMNLFFPVLKIYTSRLGKRVQNGTVTEYAPLYGFQQLEADQAILYFEEGTRIRNWEKKLFNIGFHVEAPVESENAYAREKDKLEKRLIASADSGNIAALEQALSDMDGLYTIYLEGEE